jgi:predicted nucleotidyltransferase
MVRLKEELEATLGRQVDIGERAAMTERVAATAKSELVRVF